MLVPTVILAMFDLEQAKQIYRARAKRHGYWITHDRHTGTWSLVDVDLKRPLVGLHNSNLVDIARAILALPSNGNGMS